MDYKKKLIEVALPLEEINEASVTERYSKLGHPSRLHLWWARRPLAVTRGVIWSSLVDDPSAHPEEFPTEEAQNAERERLFDILRQLVLWENSSNPKVLNAAKAEILRSTDGNPPALLDPFAGGGAIPLEAQRLGLEAHASDLNPVAVMINKAMIEIPPKFAGQPPVNPESKKLFRTWVGAQGLAEDVRYYGEWMKQKAWEKIGHLYPKVRDENGKEHTVIAWIWARAVKCPSPACGWVTPLVSSFVLSSKEGNNAYIQPVIEENQIRYEVKKGKNAPKGTMRTRNGSVCIHCGQPMDYAHIKAEGRANRIYHHMIAIAAQGRSGRIYLSPNEEHITTAKINRPELLPPGEMPKQALGFVAQLYGPKKFTDLFTNRQLIALTTFSELISEAQNQLEVDGGSREYSNAVATYLAFVVNKIADYNSSLCHWQPAGGKAANTFSRQAIPITWDFAEANVFSDAYGGWSNKLAWTIKSIELLPATTNSYADQADAQSGIKVENVMVSTDPPYYDNIGYADLSDFFYIWLRQSLKLIYPDLLSTILVPKAEELVANPYRFKAGKSEAQEFFEDGMLHTFKQIYMYANEETPVSVYYAYKQSDTDANSKTSSTGWETMLSAIIQAGFSITGTWPIRMELANRTRGLSSNALASTIVLVCRKRTLDSPVITRRDFINTLKRELKPALQKLQAANIAPVDLAQSAIGPGMGVYSRYSQVLEADGSPMSVRSALQIINQELDLFFTEQDGELDSDSRFCVDLYTQYAFNQLKFGEADVLARAKNTSVEKLAGRGVLFAERGVVRLLTREEIPAKPDKEIIWLLTQQLTHAIETDGVTGAAQIVADILTSEPDLAKALAYRLFTLAERKGWAAEALAYNSLVIAWPEVQTKAAQLRSRRDNGKQPSLFD